MKALVSIAVIIFLNLDSLVCQSLSQDVIGSSGDYFVGSNGSLSSTIGESETETIGTGKNILTQGFQQGSVVITSLNIIPQADLEVNVFPNPATNYIILQIKNLNEKSLQYVIYDLEGKEFMRRNVTSFEEKIDLQNLKPSIYLLKVLYNSDELNIYKIIKY